MVKSQMKINVSLFVKETTSQPSFRVLPNLPPANNSSATQIEFLDWIYLTNIGRAFKNVRSFYDFTEQ